MALPTFLPEQSELQKQPPPKRKKRKQQETQKRGQTQTQNQKSHKPASPWDQFKNLLTCKQIEGSRVHDPSKNAESGPYPHSCSSSSSSSSKLSSSCSSICSFRDVAHGNTRIVHRAENSPDSSSVSRESRLLTRKTGQHGSSSRYSTGTTRSNGGGSYTSSSSSLSSSSCRAMHFRKLSGCYECHMIVDPSRHPISPRICSCSQCGEVFPKLESLELHQAVRHAVSELGPEDSGRNIVEIIFKSSWLKKDSPICKIERILKVHNTQRTIQRFEDCRDVVKSRALQSTRKDPRCAADGNELLRFHCTTLTCSLGSHGASSLCGSVPGCGVCTVIRHGFHGGAGGIRGVRTTASSGRAHDSLVCPDSRRAMLLCRVIAGRVKRATGDADRAAPGEQTPDNSAAYDSVAGCAGVYSNLEELLVFNPRAILPCFVVIYNVVEP